MSIDDCCHISAADVAPRTTGKKLLSGSLASEENSAGEIRTASENSAKARKAEALCAKKRLFARFVSQLENGSREGDQAGISSTWRDQVWRTKGP